MCLKNHIKVLLFSSDEKKLLVVINRQMAIPAKNAFLEAPLALWVETWTRAKIQKRKTMVFIA